MSMYWKGVENNLNAIEPKDLFHNHNLNPQLVESLGMFHDDCMKQNVKMYDINTKDQYQCDSEYVKDIIAFKYNPNHIPSKVFNHLNFHKDAKIKNYKDILKTEIDRNRGNDGISWYKLGYAFGYPSGHTQGRPVSYTRWVTDKNNNKEYRLTFFYYPMDGPRYEDKNISFGDIGKVNLYLCMINDNDGMYLNNHSTKFVYKKSNEGSKIECIDYLYEYLYKRFL